MDLPEALPSTLATERIFDGHVFNVRRDRVRLEDGRIAELDIVEHRGSAAILALTAGGELLLVRQYRHPAGRFLWELPAGVIEPGESVIQGALRELAEETGFRADRSRELGGCYPTPGYCDEILHFVLVEELTAGTTDFDPDEQITVTAFSPQDLAGLMARGQIADAKTLLAIAWLQGDRSQLLGASSDILGISGNATS